MKKTKHTKKMRAMALLMLLCMLFGLTGCSFTDPSAIKPKPYDLNQVIRPESSGQYQINYTFPTDDLTVLADAVFEGADYTYDEARNIAYNDRLRLSCFEASGVKESTLASGTCWVDLYMNAPDDYYAAVPSSLFYLHRSESGLALLNSLADRPTRDEKYQHALDHTERIMQATGLPEYSVKFSGKLSAKALKQTWSEYVQREFNANGSISDKVVFSDVYVVIYRIAPTEIPEHLKTQLSNMDNELYALFVYDKDGLTCARISCVPTLQTVEEREICYSLEEAYEKALKWVDRDDVVLVHAYFGLEPVGTVGNPYASEIPLYDGVWTFRFVAPTLISELPKHEAELLTSLGIRGRYKEMIATVNANTGHTYTGKWKYYSNID